MIRENNIREALTFIKQKTNYEPKLALILGSGLGSFAMKVNDAVTIDSSEIPNYPVSSVHGHVGKLIFGNISNGIKTSLPLLIFQGRIHFYEFESLDMVVFPIILAYKLGVKKLIITNAAGGINDQYVIGDLMLIKDILHITFLQLPLFKYTNLPFLNKDNLLFDNRLQQRVIKCALQLNMTLRQGNYCWLKGPSYETAAEIQMLKHLGADAVGMSTVPEIYIAHNLGIKTVGLSLISNLAAGLSTTKLSHEKVTEIADQVKDKFSCLIENLILSIN